MSKNADMAKNKFQLFTEFLPIIFNSPLSVLKYLNSKNIKRLSIALKNEPTDQIVYNLRNLLRDGQLRNGEAQRILDEKESLENEKII